MDLPSFTDLLAYAKGEGDLPQRFYLTPEHERLADWRLLSGGTELPVHSQIICYSSKVLLGMAAEGLKPDEPLPLPDSSLAEALTFLRITYSREPISTQTISFLVEKDVLYGVLRLADALDSATVKTPLVEGLLAATADKKYDYLAPRVLEYAHELNLDSLAAACVSACSRAYDTMLAEAGGEMSGHEIHKMIDFFNDSPLGLKTALYTACAYRPPPGDVLYRLLQPDYLPPLPALHNIAIKLPGMDEQGFTPVNVKSAFSVNNIDFKVDISMELVDPEEDGVELELTLTGNPGSGKRLSPKAKILHCYANEFSKDIALYSMPGTEGGVYKFAHMYEYFELTYMAHMGKTLYIQIIALE